MKANKTELREFIDGRVAKNISQTEADMDKMIKDLGAKYVYENSDVVGLLSLEQEAKNLGERIQYVADSHSLESNDSIVSSLSNINYYIANIHSQLCSTMSARIRKVVKDDSYYNQNFGIKEAEQSKLYDEKLLEITRTALYRSKEFYSKIESLKKLKRELNDVISGEANGTRAYHKLVSLGVDMSGFEPEEKQLPAIQSLSVDADLFKRG
jgi:hypothetical protein